MIAVCDVNTIWRQRPFAALAERADVLAVAPCDKQYARTHPIDATGVLPVVLPRGWASKTAWLGQRLLWRRIRAEARKRGQQIKCVVVTSPHYATLLGLLPSSVRTIYYASDDYRSYEGWKNMDELEANVVRRVDHAAFISDALAERARKEYQVSESKISVCMNGTEERFFPDRNEAVPLDPPAGSFVRPIAGVVGGINDRLDFLLLKQCADLPGIGSLLLVGPLPEKPSAALMDLLQHPKVAAVGAQPHGSIHQWFRCLDVALIPYAKTELNRYCSPMRLFDHMASGVPIVATDACPQVEAFGRVLDVCAEEASFIRAVSRRVAEERREDRFRNQLAVAREQVWDCRAKLLLETITKKESEK